MSIINSTEARPIRAPPSNAKIGSNEAMFWTADVNQTESPTTKTEPTDRKF